MSQKEHPILFNEIFNDITKIEAVYCLRTVVKPPKPSRVALLEEYRERLVLDRAADTITHTQENDAGQRITHRYELPGKVSELLDGFPLGIFSIVMGNPPDAMDDPDQTRTYSITVSTRYGEARTIAGSFDRDGLPRDWAEFVDDVLTFISMYEGYELFNHRLYGRRKRRKSDYIYCSVSFEEGGQTYSYLARDDSYAVGDRVVVPAGRENREVLAQIESISYYAAGEAPFPVERTKYILRKYEDDTDHDE